MAVHVEPLKRITWAPSALIVERVVGRGEAIPGPPTVDQPAPTPASTLPVGRSTENAERAPNAIAVVRVGRPARDAPRYGTTESCPRGGWRARAARRGASSPAATASMHAWMMYGTVVSLIT